MATVDGDGGESKYVYLINDVGLYRFKIPQSFSFDDRAAHQSEPEYEVERVCSALPAALPNFSTVGMLPMGPQICLVGGNYWQDWTQLNTHTLYVFSPPTIQDDGLPLSLPLDDLPSFPSNNTYQPIMSPFVFPTQNHIYFLTLFDDNFFDQPIFTFQSYDLVKQCFHSLKCPPLSVTDYNVFFVAHFLLLDYMYLFIKQSTANVSPLDIGRWHHHAFSFNTTSSPSIQWENLDPQFNTQSVPIPYLHTGDTGLSVEFPDNIRILVALHSNKPTAYRVSLDKDGASLQFLSHRILLDHRSNLYDSPVSYRNEMSNRNMDKLSHLLNIGDGRFCVIYSSMDTPLMVYIFKMNFLAEYENGCKDVNGNPPPVLQPSVEILSSRKFKHDIVVFNQFKPLSVCLAPGPASAPRCLPEQTVELPKGVPRTRNQTVEENPGIAYVNDVD